MRVYRAWFIDDTELASYIDITVDSRAVARHQAQEIVDNKNRQSGYNRLRLVSVKALSKKENDD